MLMDLKTFIKINFFLIDLRLTVLYFINPKKVY